LQCFTSRASHTSGLAVACALAAQGASAQTAGQSSSDDKDQQVHETVVITANGSQVDLPADYAGGQVARVDA